MTGEGATPMPQRNDRSSFSEAMAEARAADTAYNRSFDAWYLLFGWLYRRMLRRHILDESEADR